MTDPRHAYVRFYLTVLSQLDEVREALARTAESTRAAVAPFTDVIAAVDDAEIKRALDAPPVPVSTAHLWRPQDPALLTGVVDVYDVVGRFTFQGEDDQNIARVAAVVRAAADEVDRQRKLLAALSRVPAAATQRAEGLSQQEIAAAETARAKRLEPFEPVAAQLRVQCGRVLDAVAQIARPDLTKLDTADALYKDYVRRMNALYHAALPYLRRALSELCAVAQVEVPPSWPDTLPFHPALPPELVTPPPTDTAAVTGLKTQIEDTHARKASLARGAEDLALGQRRYESEKLALLQRETDIMNDVHVAKNIVRWATKSDELDGLLQAVHGANQQKQSRVALVAQLQVQHQQLTATVDALKSEIAQREQEAASTLAAYEKEKSHPPALFGKDEWRRRVEDLEHDLTDLRATLVARQNVHAQSTNELNSVTARVEAEKTQITLIDRALDDAHAREQVIRKELGEIEQQLGAHAPAHRVTLPQADEYLAKVWTARNEVRARIDQLTAQHRAAHEEIDRVGVQTRQLDAELARLTAALEQARVEAAEAYKKGLAELAERRKSGFTQHVQQVLAPFEESLREVDRIFIEPARQVLIQRSSGEVPKAGSLRAQAEGLAQALAQLAPGVESALATQSEVLKRVQTEFCDKVQDAVRAAWAA